MESALLRTQEGEDLRKKCPLGIEIASKRNRIFKGSEQKISEGHYSKDRLRGNNKCQHFN